MKREFKKGDRVLVRNNDLEEWQVKEFKRVNLAHPLYPFVDTDDGAWSQCRHIDDFRTGDKVQVRDENKDEWKDAVYGCYMVGDDYVHCAMVEVRGQHETFIQCRWHPSMPWADKEEPLTLEQRVEALERKLNDQ